MGVNQFYSAAALRELIGVSFAANKANMYFLAPKLIWISKQHCEPGYLARWARRAWPILSERGLNMPTMDEMRQGGTPFDTFLYATLGKDRNDNSVTVLSALARLGLEPWDAASDLASLTRDEARSRLDTVLIRFTDVPTLKDNHAAVSRRLIDLLPKGARQQARLAGDAALQGGKLGIGSILGVLMVVLYLIHSLVVGFDGTGN